MLDEDSVVLDENSIALEDDAATLSADDSTAEDAAVAERLGSCNSKACISSIGFCCCCACLSLQENANAAASKIKIFFMISNIAYSLFFTIKYVAFFGEFVFPCR